MDWFNIYYMKEDNIKYIITMFGNMCKDTAIKCIATGTLVVTEFFVDAMLTKAIVAIFFLILFDWITGIFAAKVSGDVIKSSKIIRTPIKIVVYFMLITGARIAEYSLPEIVGFLDDTVIAFLALTELISVLENTGKMGYAIPKKLLQKLIYWRDEK